MEAPILQSEAGRLAALRRYRILDTAPEEAFDDITRLAAFICDTPFASMTLIDQERQWFKSRRGLTYSETPRDVSLCAHTILRSEPLIVEDLLRDERFCDNPLICGEPHLRFYAGVPLLTPDGYALGAICVADQKPRQLNEEQQRALQSLSRTVMTTLELRRVSRELADAARNLRTLSGLLPICSFCRGVRNDEGYWQEVEAYIQTHTDARFSPGICPKCARIHFPTWAPPS